MSTFELAIPTILRHEGGLADNSADPGGITNFGISLRWLRSIRPTATAQDIIQMTRDGATVLYRQYWWDAYQYGRIEAQAVATKLFDASVNMGASRAHKLAQIVVGVTVDGILGPKSFGEINAMPSLKFLVAYQEQMAQFYRGLVEANPGNQVFLKGWLNRAYDRN